jgi:hypothetical protein
MKRNLLVVLLSTLFVFVWNAISWTVLPFHSNSLQNLPEKALVNDIEQVMSGSGVYHYPGLPNKELSIAEISEKLQEGPRITFMVYQEGSFELFEPTTLLISLLLNLLLCIVLLLILSKLQLTSFSEVLKWCLLFGMLVSLTSDFALMNWYKFPLGYAIVNVMDHLVAFSLIGVVYWYFSRKASNA